MVYDRRASTTGSEESSTQGGKSVWGFMSYMVSNDDGKESAAHDRVQEPLASTTEVVKSDLSKVSPEASTGGLLSSIGSLLRRGSGVQDTSPVEAEQEHAKPAIIVDPAPEPGFMQFMTEMAGEVTDSVLSATGSPVMLPEPAPVPDPPVDKEEPGIMHFMTEMASEVADSVLSATGSPVIQPEPAPEPVPPVVLDEPGLLQFMTEMASEVTETVISGTASPAKQPERQPDPVPAPVVDEPGFLQFMTEITTDAVAAVPRALSPSKETTEDVAEIKQPNDSEKAPMSREDEAGFLAFMSEVASEVITAVPVASSPVVVADSVGGATQSEKSENQVVASDKPGFFQFMTEMAVEALTPSATSPSGAAVDSNGEKILSLGRSEESLANLTITPTEGAVQVAAIAAEQASATTIPELKSTQSDTAVVAPSVSNPPAVVESAETGFLRPVQFVQSVADSDRAVWTKRPSILEFISTVAEDVRESIKSVTPTEKQETAESRVVAPMTPSELRTIAPGKEGTIKPQSAPVSPTPTPQLIRGPGWEGKEKQQLSPTSYAMMRRKLAQEALRTPVQEEDSEQVTESGEPSEVLSSDAQLHCLVCGRRGLSVHGARARCFSV